MEREADEGGQILCAAAGYDPIGMSTFLTTLAMSSRLELGYTRNPDASSTRTRARRSARRPTPCARERSAGSAIAAIGDPRAALLRRIAGLEIGPRPEAGLFQGDRFVHPALGFTIRFPSGWRQSNSNRAVGAVQPRGEAVVFLAADVPPGEVGQVAQRMARAAGDDRSTSRIRGP